MLARRRSRVMPALWTRTSRPSGTAAAIRCAASSAVMSRGSAVAPSASAVRASSSPVCGTSRQITRAPSRASTEATEAPMPRAAPVTSAVRPASGAAQSATGAGASAVSSITWPLMYAERGESRKRRVDSAPATPSGAMRSSCTVAPLPISLPRERTNPSNACWAAAWWWSSAEGRTPSTTTRPPGARERTTGCSAAWTPASPPGVTTAVASSTIPAGRSAWSARSMRSVTSRPVAARSAESSSVTVESPAVRWSSGPSSVGVPGDQRRSGAGCGRPRRRVRKRPGAVPVKCR